MTATRRIADQGMPSTAGFEDVGSIGAPVLDHSGRPAGVLGLGIPTQRVGPADVPRLGPVVSRAAAETGAALGHLAPQS